MYVPSVIYNSEIRKAFTFEFLMIEINNKKGGFIRLNVHGANIVMHMVLMCPPYLWYPNNKAKLENTKDSTTQMPKPVGGTDQTCYLRSWLLLVIIKAP
jgi:hypothetical protein